MSADDPIDKYVPKQAPDHLPDARNMVPDAQAMPREDVIEGLVNKFLAWPLPESVCSDLCATKRGYPHRSGTTLMTATEAKQMVEHLLVDVFASAESFDRLVASQRETIRRLEQQAEMLKGCLEENRKHADQLQARLTASEREVRHRMWTLHYSRMQHVPYGDDGQLDCNSCGRDYATAPMDELVQWEMLDASKLVTASEAKGKWTTARPTVAGWYWWRKLPDHKEEIVRLFLRNGFLCVDWGTKDADYLSPWAKDVDGEWQGPLTPGEE